MNLKKLSDPDLLNLKNEVKLELMRRHREKSGRSYSKARFESVLGLDYFYHEGKSRLKVLSEMTEERFSRFRNVGVQTVEVAKDELAKEGLSFKTV
jgi:DNA-directed RNA polymerase alpha subunit